MVEINMYTFLSVLVICVSVFCVVVILSRFLKNKKIKLKGLEIENNTKVVYTKQEITQIIEGLDELHDTKLSLEKKKMVECQQYAMRRIKSIFVKLLERLVQISDVELQSTEYREHRNLLTQVKIEQIEKMLAIIESNNFVHNDSVIWDRERSQKYEYLIATYKESIDNMYDVEMMGISRQEYEEYNRELEKMYMLLIVELLDDLKDKYTEYQKKINDKIAAILKIKSMTKDRYNEKKHIDN